MLRRLLLLALPFAVAALAPQVSSAAQLHWPLPDNSTARNGEPQAMMKHTKVPAQVRHFAPLPAATLHPKAAQGLKKRYSGTPIDVLRYHYDNYPTGWDQNETDLTPASVGSGSFGLLTTLNVDGNVIAQPLLVSNYQMPDGTTHNVLLVVTGHDSVYAFDAQDYSLQWKASMGTAQSSDDVGCGDVVPEYGISSTPIIVRNGASATVYLVAATEPAQYSFHTKLHALDLGTGKDVMHPVEIKPEARLSTGGKIHFDPQNQWSRASLAYNSGSLYVSVGSHCDNNAGSISGWELRYDASTLNLTAKFNTIEAQAGYELSSIWMAGYSPAIDANGNVFVVTGNGNFNLGRGAKGYGESVLSFTPDLNKKQVQNFTPSDYVSLNNGDTDFGSGGAMLIPTVSGQAAPPMLVAMGKESILYLLDSTHLGGLEGNHSKPLQKLQFGGGCWCGPAYFGGGKNGVVFYQSGWDVLRAFKVDADSTPKLKQIAAGTSGAGYGGSFPVVSSNGGKANSALVWLIRRDTTEALEAYDAASLGDPIFQANAGSWNTSGPFLTPLVANGRVYVPAYQTLTVFGLTN